MDRAETIEPERRRDPRMPLHLIAHCQLGSRYARETVRDLSPAGLRLSVKEPVPEGTPVRVALALPCAEGLRFCTLLGNVVYTMGGMTGRTHAVGVHFDPELSAFDRDVLGAFLATNGPPVGHA